MKLHFLDFSLFPSSKIDFWPFFEIAKNGIWSKKFHDIDVFDFMSFFWTGLLLILWPTMCEYQNMICNFKIYAFKTL